MTVPDDVEARIVDRAEYVEEALSVLADKRTLDEETYRTDREQRAIVEREFQTAIEACIDIAGLLLRTTTADTPDTYAERFGALEEEGVLSPETSDRMRSAAGFRNVLTHQYGDDIDDALVYEHLQTELECIVTFLREVRTFLDEDGPEREDSDES
ncbi:MAG: type VII toxin-antitoxin system HepT family RNase toxin [Halanaeroarchaeum sp.]